MSVTKLKHSPEITKSFPDALQTAKDLIKSNPNLLHNNVETEIVLAEALVNFFKVCDAYLNPPFTEDSFFEMAGNIAKNHAKTLNVNL